VDVLLERLTDLGAGLLPLLGHILLWLVALAGLAGSLFPAFPGATLIWGAAVVHGLVFGFEPLGAYTLISLTILMGVSIGGQYAVSAFGARRFGSSGWGIAGAAVGMLVGTFAIPIPLVGSLIGAFLGATGVEFVRAQRPSSPPVEDADGDETPEDVTEEEAEKPVTKTAFADTRAAAAGAARAGFGAALGAVVGLAVEFGTALVMIGALFVGFVS
jgi:uncharacterized protein YqgC (DUF456 family)